MTLEQNKKQDDNIDRFKAKGFHVEARWPNEYVLMLNDQLQKVRIYDHGGVMISDPITGEYKKEVAME